MTTELVRTYYDNDILKEEYFVVNDVKEGEFKEYFITGQLYSICNYINGIIEGELKCYHTNGQIEYSCNYVNGVVVDEGKQYDEDGNEMYRCIFRYN